MSYFLVLFATAGGAVGQGGDLDPPIAESFDPPPGAVDIPLDTVLVLTFNEPVEAGNSGAQIAIVGGGSPIIVDPNGTQVSSEGSTVTITPPQDLVPSSDYWIKIQAGAFQDLAGNDFEGIDDPETWNFSTVDLAPPVVTAVSPLDDAVAVALDGTLEVTFDEPVSATPGKFISIKEGAVVVEQIPVDGNAVTIDGASVSVDPVNDLEFLTRYSILVDDGAFQDASGNLFVGISDPTAWNFVTTADGPDWGMLNGGSPVGARFGTDDPFVAALETVDGSIVYSGGANNVGRFLGRLHNNAINGIAEWQLWTGNGWSSARDAQPISIERPHNKWWRMNLFAHPDIPGGLLGFANQGRRVSTVGFDFHGMPVHLIFDGSEFKTWTSGNDYDEYFSTALFASGAKTGTDFDKGTDFAFDAASRTGIAVGFLAWPVGGAAEPVERKLTAARLNLDESPLIMHWNRPAGEPGFWSPDGQAPGSQAWVLDENADPERFRFKAPRVVHIPGTPDFFVAFTLLDNENLEPVRLGAALYSGSTGEWYWWDGQVWQPAYGQETPYLEHMGNLLPNIAAERYAYELVPLSSGKVVIIADIFDGSNSAIKINEHYAIVHDSAAEPSISQPVLLGLNANNVSEVGGSSHRFAVGADATETSWFAYVDPRGDEEDSFRIHLRKRDASGDWSAPQLIWEEPGETWPEEIAFFDGVEPVIFLNRMTSGVPELIAIGREPSTYWAGEVPLILTPVPERFPLDPSSGLELQSSVATETDLLLGLAADNDGYFYGSKPSGSRVRVAPPGFAVPEDLQVWGKLWDYFVLPGGVAVYDPAVSPPEIFAVRQLTGSSSNPSLAVGRLRVWEMGPQWLFSPDPPIEPRDHSYGFSGNVPDDWVREYSPQHLEDALFWSQSLAVDPVRGRLFATSAASNEILVYDIVNTFDIASDDPAAPFQESEFLQKIKSSNEDEVLEIVAGLVGNGFLQQPGDGLLVWSDGSDWPAVRDYIIEDDPTFPELSGPGHDDTDFMRNLQKVYKDKRDRPVLLARISLPQGTGAGEFAFPTGVSVDRFGFLYVVDTENHRVQKLRVNNMGTGVIPILEFGSLGRGPGELFYPVGVAVGDNDEVFVTDPENDRVVVFDTAGNFLHEFSRFETLSGTEISLETPLGIYAGRPGYLYLAHDDAETGQKMVSTFTHQ